MKRCKVCGNYIVPPLKNVSTFEDCPVCSNCADGDFCFDCGDTWGPHYYDDDSGKILCQDCLVQEHLKRDHIQKVTIYLSDEGNEIGCDDDLSPVVRHLIDNYGVIAESEDKTSTTHD